MTTKGEQRRASKPGWLAWSISLGEVLLLLILAFALSRYWLMLPVWMRRSAGTFLVIAFAIVAFRLFRFVRKRTASRASNA